jgi:hypothetical protein
LIRNKRVAALAARNVGPIKKQPSENADKNGSLNFKVTEEFRREFKVFAANTGMTMIDLLKEGFELSKKRRG